MLNFLTKGLSKIFESKSNCDIKSLEPIVAQINEHFCHIKTIHTMNCEKTQDFKYRIQQYLSGDRQKRFPNIRKAEKEELELEEKETIFSKVDKLKKERDEAIEEILNELLPEAFAVKKRSPRRFSTNEYIRVKATDLDRDLAVKNPFIKIEGEDAIYPNKRGSSSRR